MVATNSATGIFRRAQTNEAGLYFLGELRPGPYDIEVEAAGFTRAVRRGLSLRVEDRLRLDFTLRVSQVAETLEVRGEAPLLQSENNTLGRVIEEQSIKQLPLRGRNAFELILLTPGAQQRSDDEQPRLSGGRARTGEFVLDGASITTPRRGQIFTQPNVDAIQEFKVQTSGLSAEFGRTVGGVVNVALKSGSNRISGNLYEFHRNSSVNARNFFAAQNPKLIQNQFGAMIGGPIVKNRLFFFGDFESLRQAEEALFNRVLPTAQMKQGDFAAFLGSATLTDALGRSAARGAIFDPATTRRTATGRFVRDPFPQNQIPVSRFDAPIAKVMALYPEPNRPGQTQNFYKLSPRHTDNNQFDVRVDWRATDKDLMFVRYSWEHQFSATAQPFRGSSGYNLGNFNRYMTAALNWTRTISPTLLSVMRLSMFRGVQERLLDPTPSAPLGIPNLNYDNLPVFNIAGYNGLGDAVPFNPVESDVQFQEIMTLVRGKHILKAGADLRRFPINDLQWQFTASYDFSALQTADPANPGQTGHPFASFLLGQANAFDNSTLRGRFYYRSLYAGLFFQDDIKLTPAFSLNLGLRYDLEQQPRELRWQGSNFDLRLGRPVTMQELGRNFIQFTDRVNFAPRVGFAWRVPKSANTIIRSHYGIFYIPLTGRATSAFSRFPADQRVGIQSDGVNAAVIVSQTPPIVPSSDGKGFAHDAKNERARLGYFQQWNFDVQHQLPGEILIQASYAGSVGRFLMMNQDWNVIPIEVVQRQGRGAQAMRPYPDFGFILSHDERQNSSYNALQLGAERRFRQGMFFSVAYTFSKFLDYNEDNFSSMFPMDPYNLRLERGLSQSHFPHRFVSAAVYDLPFGRRRRWLQTGPLELLAGGWQLASIVTLESGQQVWITQAANTSSMFSRQFRPNLVGNPVLPKAERTLGRWFNLSAFQAPPPLTLGNSNKFPNVQGPGLANWDFSLIRSFFIPKREGMRFELRGDFFNLLNRTNFNPPSGALGTPNFGRITSARLPRTLQFGLKFWY